MTICQEDGIYAEPVESPRPSGYDLDSRVTNSTLSSRPENKARTVSLDNRIDPENYRMTERVGPIGLGANSREGLPG